MRWRAILGVEEGEKYELFLMTWFCLELVFDDYDMIDANAMLVGIMNPVYSQMCAVVNFTKIYTQGNQKSIRVIVGPR